MYNHFMKKNFIFIVFFPLIIWGCGQQTSQNSAQATTGVAEHDDLGTIARAYENKESGFFVSAHGFVGRILSDDINPPRHQRFIVRLTNGQTLLVTHNIDIAPRIDDLKVGDRIDFRGQYEWNEKGGLIHKTHHDPSGRLAGGWIEHSGRRYE